MDWSPREASQALRGELKDPRAERLASERMLSLNRRRDDEVYEAGYASEESPTIGLVQVYSA